MAVPVPTTQGMPSSRDTIAAWQVRPPSSVTTAAARLSTGSQSGSVIRATSTSPARKLGQRLHGDRITRTGPVADLCRRRSGP